MKYEYRGAETIAAEQARHEKLQTELEQARQAYKAAQKLIRENRRIEEEILRTKRRTIALATSGPQLPQPIHGGRTGLKAAANEAAQWHRKGRVA